MVKTALIFLVIFIFPLFLFASDLEKHLSEELSRISLIEGSEVIWENEAVQVMGIKGKATHLRSELPVEDVLNYYKVNIQEAGWQIDHCIWENRICVFTKESEYFYLGVQGNGKGYPNDIYLVVAPQSLAVCELSKEYFLKKELKEDAPGEDPESIPRYPGSKRRINIFAVDEGKVFMYEAEDSIEDITAFYKDYFQKAGWKMSGEFKPRGEYSEDLKILFFEKGEDNVSINVARVNIEGRARSLITILNNMIEEFAQPE
jgi:hypothetical protein